MKIIPFIKRIFNKPKYIEEKVYKLRITPIVRTWLDFHEPLYRIEYSYSSVGNPRYVKLRVAVYASMRSNGNSLDPWIGTYESAKSLVEKLRTLEDLINFQEEQRKILEKYNEQYGNGSIHQIV